MIRPGFAKLARWPVLTGLVLATALLGACSQRPVTMPAPQPAQIRVTPLPAQTPALSGEPVHERAFRSDTPAPGLSRYRLARERPGPAVMQLVLDSGKHEAGPGRTRQIFLLNETGPAGTLRRWREQLAALGLQASVRTGAHSTELELRGSDEQLPTMQSLLGQWLRPPVWQDDDARQTDLDIALQQRLQTLSGNAHQRLWSRLAYGAGHPYNLEAADNDQSAAELHADWLRAAGQARLLLLVSAAPAALEQLPPPDWPAADQSAKPARALTPVALPPAPARLTLHLLHAARSPQVSIRLGDVWLLPADASEALTEQRLLDASATLLGGGIGGRLWADLREVQGLAYSLGASAIETPLVHGLSLQASGAPEKTAALLQGLLSHRELLKTAVAEPLELDIIRAQQDGERARRLDDSDTQLDFLSQLWLRGQSHADLAAADARLATLSATDLQAFARQRLAAQPVIVIRGDADQLRAGLREHFPDAELIEH